jgi:hypothetical protein
MPIREANLNAGAQSAPSLSIFHYQLSILNVFRQYPRPPRSDMQILSGNFLRNSGSLSFVSLPVAQ